VSYYRLQRKYGGPFIKYSKDSIPFPERKETRTSVKKKRTSAMRKIKKKKNKRSIDEEY